MNFKYIVRKRQIGDVLWIEPVIRQLATRYEKVYVHTKFNTLFENYPLKNVIFKKDLSFFEKVIMNLEKRLGISLFFINLDLSYEKKPKMPFLHAYEEKASLPITNEYPKIYLSDEEQSVKIVSYDKYVVLHIESFSERNYRRVFGLDWETIVSHLAGLGFKVIQIGKTPLAMSGTEIVTTSLREMITVIDQSQFFIGLDSGPGNIAASLGKPSLLFFGAVNPAYRHFPELFKGFFLQQYCEFAGCYHDVVQTAGPICKLVGEEGIPKCSLHTNSYVINYINKLIAKYNLC